MHGYLFTASTTRAQIRPVHIGRGQTAMRPEVWNACEFIIAYAESAGSAQKLFEAWLSPKADDKNPQEMRINKIFCTPFLEQMLTETGNVPIDWPQLANRAFAEQAANPIDDFEQGYWLDVNTTIRPGPGIEALRQELPEDIRSGLNWSSDKQFFSSSAF